VRLRWRLAFLFEDVFELLRKNRRKSKKFIKGSKGKGGKKFAENGNKRPLKSGERHAKLETS
jgi:hypothetical protein